MLEKNKIYRSEITDITSEGNGVCKIDGIAVFVPNTAVGDVADVKIVKVLKNFCYGIVSKLITPSQDRIEDGCEVYRKCGGCKPVDGSQTDGAPGGFRSLFYCLGAPRHAGLSRRDLQRMGRKTSSDAEA